MEPTSSFVHAVNFIKSQDNLVSEKQIKNLSKFADAARRFGISVTNLLPFSSRGLVVNLALTPIRLVQSAMSEKKFMDKMREYVDRDWNAGIQDLYIDLEPSGNSELRKQVVEENFKYAAFMYPTSVASGMGVNTKREGGIILPNVDFPNQDGFKALDDKLKTLGFKVDDERNYYNLKTGNMLNLVYDKKNNEVVVCFMGLGNEDDLIIDDKDKAAVGSKNVLAAAEDSMGGISRATLEAIQIGAILKEAFHDTDVTPVLIGHSHGGGLAQAGALANGIKGVVFNSRPLGAGVRRYIGQSKVAKNAENLTAFSGRGDWLSGSRAANTLAVIFERLTGIPVPRTMGTGYHLPDLKDEGMAENHVDFYKAFKKLKDMD